MKKYEEYIKKNKLGEVYNNKSFKDITTIKIGGKIMMLYYPNSIESFVLFYKYYLLFKDKKIVIIGNGSNILANSKTFNGIVVCFKKCICKYFLYKNTITINSGVLIMDVINYLKDKNLGGFEKLSYIPATVGGMIKMNASCYNVNISDNLVSLKGINEKGEVILYKKEDLVFKYRYCNIDDNFIILECVFNVYYNDKENIKKEINNIKQNRLTKYPLDKYNAGSTFKNPIGFKAWELIDKIGLRGFNINDACVSIKHSNFLINNKSSSSEDMYNLIKIIKKKVKKEFNVILETEWIFINF